MSASKIVRFELAEDHRVVVHPSGKWSLQHLSARSRWKNVVTGNIAEDDPELVGLRASLPVPVDDHALRAMLAMRRAQLNVPR